MATGNSGGDFLKTGKWNTPIWKLEITNNGPLPDKLDIVSSKNY